MANQSNKKFTVYICDDNSPENPKKLINSYSNRLNLIYFRFNENVGGKNLVAHWKRSINKIQDEKWIMILCDDDVLGPNCVQEFYDNLTLLDDKKINVFRFSSVIINQFGEVLSPVYHSPKYERSTSSIIRKIKYEMRSSLSEYIFRKETYENNGFIDIPLAWHTDDLAWLEFTEGGYILSTDRALFKFRISDHNISRKNFEMEIKTKARFFYYSVLLFSHLNKFETKDRALLISRYVDLMIAQNKFNLKFFWLYFNFWIKNRKKTSQIKLIKKLYRKLKGFLITVSLFTA